MGAFALCVVVLILSRLVLVLSRLVLVLFVGVALLILISFSRGRLTAVRSVIVLETSGSAFAG
ncbi:MAG: hypothetical protein C0484_10050 [Rhodospirillum sp.]|nr:hypothetical protein [Rhodospirillum sp.]